ALLRSSSNFAAQESAGWTIWVESSTTLPDVVRRDHWAIRRNPARDPASVQVPFGLLRDARRHHAALKRGARVVLQAVRCRRKIALDYRASGPASRYQNAPLVPPPLHLKPGGGLSG